jgi:hypothetical protein
MEIIERLSPKAETSFGPAIRVPKKDTIAPLVATELFDPGCGRAAQRQLVYEPQFLALNAFSGKS